MALYDRSKTRSFYSELAHEQDHCYYCEKMIRKRMNNREISVDEMNKQIRALSGSLTGKRVMKFRYTGHDFCVCPVCLTKINEEVNPTMYGAKNETVTIDKTVIVEEPAIKELAEVAPTPTAKSKKGGAKSNESNQKA